MKKKLLSLLLSITIVLALAPAIAISVNAEGSEPAGRGDTWDILYSEIVAKGSYYAYPVGTRIYFDMESNPNAPEGYENNTYLNTYDYAVFTGYIDGNYDSTYKGTYKTVVNNIDDIYTLPASCKDDDDVLTITSGDYWIFIDNNGDYEFFAVKSSGNGGSITVDSQTKYITPPHVYTNYTETVTDDVIFYNKITNESVLTELFSYGGYGYLADDITISDVLTTASNKEINLFLNGKTIDLNEEHIKVCSGATFNLYDNGTTGTIKNGKYSDGGAFEVVGTNTVFNMYGGTITECKGNRGGAVHANLGGTFHMYNGLITGNTANSAGGGVYNHSETSFHMHGGTIKGNYSAGIGGGVFNSENMSFDGKCIVDDNNAGPENNKREENVYTSNPFNLYNNDQTSLGLTEGSKVGITYSYGIGHITYNYSNPNFDQAKQIDYFFADNPNYYVAYNAGTGSGGYLEIKEKIVCKIGTIEYTSIEAALKHGGTDASEKDPNTGESDSVSTKIIMIDNDVENVTIPAGRNITLDLNGHYLLGKEITYYNVIIVCEESSPGANDAAKLTVVDSNADGLSHNFEVSGSGLWVLTDKANTKTYEDLVNNPAVTGDVIKVTGGVITSDKSNKYFRGIYVEDDAYLTLKSGNIIGNGNCGVNNYGNFVMNGGLIAGNIEQDSYGAGVHNQKSFVMKGGKITNNIADSSSGGVGGVNIANSNSSFTMTDGNILANEGAFGGVGNGGTLKIGGSAKIYGNVGSFGNNLVTVNLITIGDSTNGSDGNTILKLDSGFNVGITLLGFDGSGPYAKTGKFTENGNSIDKKYFFSDNEDFYVKYVTDHLELAVATVKVDKNIKNGNVVVDNQEATAGTTVTITSSPNSGYELDKITATDKDGGPVTVDDYGKFVMPVDSSKFPVTVSATFKKAPVSEYKIVKTGIDDNDNGLRFFSLFSLLGITTVIALKNKMK